MFWTSPRHTHHKLCLPTAPIYQDRGLLKCKNCKFHKSFVSSNKINNEPEVNKIILNGIRQTGEGFSVACKLFSTVNLPRLVKPTYAKHEEKHFIKNDKWSVFVDGLWQRRGQTSFNGCVATISVGTGKLFDLEVMSPYCRTCKLLQKLLKFAKSKQKV